MNKPVAKTITFRNFDGEMVTETYNFGLNKAELAEWMVSAPGGDLQAYIKEISEARDGKQVFTALKQVLTLSVGKREGNRLVKNQDIVDEFMQTPAYEELFMELMVNNGVGLVEFLRSIVPEDMSAGFDEEKREYSDEDLLKMTDEQFYAAVGRVEEDWTKQVLLVAMRRKNLKHAA
jgi:hypothetical protein